MLHVVASFSCRVFRGISKTFSKKRFSRLQKWQHDFLVILGPLDISNVVAHLQKQIPTGVQMLELKKYSS